MSAEPKTESRSLPEKKRAAPFYKIEWTKEDWIDFWHTLEAFQDRVAERHGIERRKA